MKMKNFTQIPNEVVFNTEVSDGAFRTYVALKSFKYGQGQVFPSERTISKQRNKTTRTIINHIKELKLSGLISYKKRGFSASNSYKFNEENNFSNEASLQENKFTSIEKVDSPLIRNSLHTKNTEIKNTKINNIGIEILRKRMEELRLKKVKRVDLPKDV